MPWGGAIRSCKGALQPGLASDCLKVRRDRSLRVIGLHESLRVRPCRQAVFFVAPAHSISCGEVIRRGCSSGSRARQRDAQRGCSPSALPHALCFGWVLPIAPGASLATVPGMAALLLQPARLPPPAPLPPAVQAPFPRSLH